jgi:hypothetical protein
MKTPQFLLAQKIGNDSVKEIIKFWNKNKKTAIDGVIGNKVVDKNLKSSKDIFILPSEFDSKIPTYANDLKKLAITYMRKYPELDNSNWGVTEACNIQYYKPRDGFGGVHYERGHMYPQKDRLLVWMTYLTNNPEGGTYFKYQDFYCPSIKGLTLIWPADFTFTHCGVIDYNLPKHIITGWFSYYAPQHYEQQKI